MFHAHTRTTGHRYWDEGSLLSAAVVEVRGWLAFRF
jgi:hypothetical protein